jgi:ABC-2 type transport system permease protein
MQVALGTRQASWPLLLAVVFTWWATVWTPLGSALVPALADRMERRAGAWRTLRSRPLSPAALYAAKLAIVSLQTLAGAAVMAAVTGVVGAALAPGPVPIGRLLMVVLLPWLCSLPLLVVGLWVSSVAGLWASAGLGVAGMVAGVLTAEGSRWVYVPWAWPVRAAIPAAGAHASGVPLKPDSALANFGLVPPVVAVSLACAAAFAVLGTLWFSRREVR